MKCALVTILLLTSGCTLGVQLDRIQDGSELTTQYRRDRFAEYRSGMGYQRGLTRAVQPQEEGEEREDMTAPASPGRAWGPAWAK